MADRFFTYDIDNKPRAVIAGGGLAGLTCARRLVEAGLEVELVEAGQQFGGRCAGWTDPTDGETAESSLQFVAAGYSRLFRLAKEVGAGLEERIAWTDQVGVLQPGAQLTVLALDPLRDWPRMAGSLLNRNLLKPVDKLTLGVTVLNGLLKRANYQGQTVSRLARDGRLNPEVIELVLRPLSRSLTLNEPEELSAWVFLTLLKHGFDTPWNLRYGSIRGGLHDWLVEPLILWLRQQGAVLRTNSAVKAIHYGSGQGIKGFELENGENLAGDMYVAALPLDVIQQIIPAELSGQPYFDRLRQLKSRPVYSVQLWFDRSFVSRDFLICLPGSPLTLLQDQAHRIFPQQGSRISGWLTGPQTADLTDQELSDLALQELARYIPASANAVLLKSLVVRHRTLLLEPGSETGRPEVAGPLSNFFLAGDFTRQDWFTTLEGAVRSGEMAATAVLKRLGWSVDEYDPRDIAHNVGLGGLRSNLKNLLASARARGRGQSD